MSTRPTPTPDPAPFPTEIGGYEILSIIGSGGMATVYSAMQKQPKRIVALKVIKGGSSDRAALHRFKREIEILGRLRHPYIAQIFDAGSYDDGEGVKPFFVMEHVPNAKTILEYVASKDLDLRDRLRLFVKVCSALDHGHRNKIIHRDVKPGNILIDRQGEPKVIDFGVARAPTLRLDDAPTEDPSRLIGTFQYMAPEHLSRDAVDLDPRCDVYALGALLYRLLTARPPLDLVGLPIDTASQMIREQVPDPPSTLRNDLDDDLDHITMTALAKERSHRYANGGELGRDVVRFLKSEPIAARPPTPGYKLRLWRRRHKTAVRATLAVVTVLILAGAYVTWDLFLKPQAPPPAPPPTPTASSDPAPETPTVETTGPQPIVLQAQRDRITALRFDPTGTRLASAAEDLTVVVWSVDEQRELAKASDHDIAVTILRFTATGERLLTGDASGHAVLLGSDDGSFIREEETSCQGVRTLELSVTDDRIATACTDLTLRVRAIGPDEVMTLRGTTGGFQCCAFSPDGQVIAAGSDRGAVYVWFTEDGHELDRLAENDRILSVTFADEGASVIAVTRRGVALVWRPGSSIDRVERFNACAGAPVLVDLDPSGRYLAAVADESVTLCDLHERTIRDVPFESEETITAIAAAPSGTRVAIGFDNGEVTIAPVGEVDPAEAVDEDDA